MGAWLDPPIQLSAAGAGTQRLRSIFLTNKPHGTLLYIGVSSDLCQTASTKHRNGTASAFTKKYGLTRLVYYEVHDLVTTAIARETSLKRWKREWKIALVERDNPEPGRNSTTRSSERWMGGVKPAHDGLQGKRFRQTPFSKNLRHGRARPAPYQRPLPKLGL